MNKFVLVIALSFVIIGYALARPGEEHYEDKYDNVNLDEILNNERLYEGYYTCITEGKRCTPDGTLLKDSIADALKNKCSKCTEKQKAGAEKVLKFLYNKKRDHFDALCKIYDPEGIYLKENEDKLKAL